MTDYIGIIGLGNAGSAVASALAKKTRVIGFDVNPDCKNAAKANGIRWANDYQEIAEHADKIILSLPKPEISVAITKTVAELSKKPKLIIETSTVTPQTAKTCFEIC